MMENDRTALCFLLILALCTRVYSANARHIITKRNYSDQSVRGYLAERILTFLRGFAGGTRYARKNFIVSSDVVARGGPIAAHQEDITTRTAA
ncbi:uncharacterized protein LOC143908339 isoform X4 [Temnothorax americanus]|uniref:uncharacterized protein LOC143908339 isoform X4 n=1 Tax=Temnothorax americanus TaxID=1964332 RepID=UPI0040696DDF